MSLRGSKGWYYFVVPSGEKYVFVKNLFKPSLINNESKIMVLDANVAKDVYIYN